MSRRLAAICCCDSTGGSTPCEQFVNACFPTLPKTVTLTFSGTYLVETIDTCDLTTVTATDYWTYSGTATGTLTSGINWSFSGIALCGSATATQTQTGKQNSYDGTTCGQWVACFTQSFNYGICNVPVLGGICTGGVGCNGGLVENDNYWSVRAFFEGTGTYQSSAVGVCCNPGCNPVSFAPPVEIFVQGSFPAGVCNPGSCDGCVQIYFAYNNAATGSYAGPFPLGNGFSDDTLTFGTRSTWTGSASLAFT